MGWQEEYRARSMSAEEAAALIRPGDTIFTPIGGDANGMMPAVLQRLLDMPDSLRVRACMPSAAQVWFTGELGDLGLNLAVDTYAGRTPRRGLVERKYDFYPLLWSNQFNVYDWRDDQEQIDVFMCQARPPDEDGYIEFGGNPWHKGDFTRRARTAILEIAPWILPVRTNERVHVSDVAAFVPAVERVRPPVARPPEPPPETKAIAGFCNEIIQDGDVIQVGAGGTSARLVVDGALEGKHDLGFHSEITPSGVLKLMMEGVINNSRKNVDNGLGVTTSVSPRNPEEERWLLEERMVEARSVTQVNSIKVVSQIERMCAINGVLQVDLTGQIMSEAIGTTIRSGAGGQPEFHIGAVLAPGGKAISVLASTTMEGKLSRIVSRVDDGTFVTVPRTFADYVVTEYGIARLAGRSQRQRAENLIAVAHPDHRGELRKALKTFFGPPES